MRLLCDKCHRGEYCETLMKLKRYELNRKKSSKKDTGNKAGEK